MIEKREDRIDSLIKIQGDIPTWSSKDRAWATSLGNPSITMPSSSGICINFCFISVIVVSFNTKMKMYGVFQAGTIILQTRKDSHAVVPVVPAPRWWLSWQSDSIFCCCWHCGFSSSIVLPLKCTGIHTALQFSSSGYPFHFLDHLMFKRANLWPCTERHSLHDTLSVYSLLGNGVTFSYSTRG